MDKDHLKAPVMRDMGMEGSFNNIMVLVLDIGYCGEEVALVMIVYHRDNPFTVPFDIRHPLVICYVCPDGVANTL